MHRQTLAVLVSALLITTLILTGAKPTHAQISCFFHPVGPALTDLGQNTYVKLLPFPPLANPSTWTYAPQTGIIGGLYPNGSNVRPQAHDAAGINIANQIQPLDSSGNPSINGKIGLISVGMSNTQMEFGTFKSVADSDLDVNDDLVIVNGALSGGTVEKWIDPSDPSYANYWNNFYYQIGQNGLTPEQIQVVWLKTTQFGQNGNGAFPASMHLLESRIELLAKGLKARLPNLKITYLSSRARSMVYAPNQLSEPGAFENGFAVRWLIERQINGEPGLNYNPALGATPISYMSWGPYLWIDGNNPRSDGRTWPLTHSNTYDCIHPSGDGEQEVAEMLMEFFKTDSTATPWFLNTPPAPDITPPSVSITTPNDGGIISGIIDVIANAIDNIGIGGVQFMLNGLNLGAEDVSSPFSIVFDTSAMPNGPYMLNARARDLAGNTATSSNINVTINNYIDTVPPTIIIDLPTPNAILSGITTLEASAYDDSVVAGVQFMINGLNFGAEDTVFPYIVSWDTESVENGPYSITATARDTLGHTASTSVSVMVENIPDTTPPVISGITATNVAQTTATISWNTDEPADTQVEFLSNCPAGGCTTPLNSNLVINHSVNITGLSSGAVYTYRVRSRDESGNLSISTNQTLETPIEPLVQDPISAWGFGSNSVTDDINGCTGCSNSNATWFTPGILSGAFDFNGTNAKLDLGSFPHMANRSTFTFSLWIRPDFAPTFNATKYIFNDGVSNNLVYLNRTHHWRFSTRLNGNIYHVTTPNTTWIQGTWHHFAATYDGNTMRLYWDGVQTASALLSGTTMVDGASTNLGGNGSTGLFFDGALDELRVYDYALSSEEVLSYFQNPTF